MSQNIYTCMEMSKQSYPDVIIMPVQRFYDYLKWKADLEEERKKMLEEQIANRVSGV